MKKSSLWSLSRRLLAVLTVLSLLLSNAELTIAAGEPIVDETNNTEPTEELKKEIQQYVKKKTAPYKYPRIVEFKEELPKTISGKIIRSQL